MAANQECCRQVAPPDGTSIRDVKALSRIMMELMEKCTKDDEAIGVEDLNRWPFDFDVVGFLLTTTSASSINELMKVSRNLVASIRI
jgi:hypothetical protein